MMRRSIAAVMLLSSITVAMLARAPKVPRWETVPELETSSVTVARTTVPQKPGGTPPNAPLLISGVVSNLGTAPARLVRIRVTVSTMGSPALTVGHGFVPEASLAAGGSSRFVIPVNADGDITSVVAVAEAQVRDTEWFFAP